MIYDSILDRIDTRVMSLQFAQRLRFPILATDHDIGWAIYPLHPNLPVFKLIYLNDVQNKII